MKTGQDNLGFFDMAKNREKDGRFKSGNTVSKGNKGGGRKSAYEEYGRAKALAEAYFDGFDADKMMQLIKKLGLRKGKGGELVIPKAKIGKVNLMDVMIANAMVGNTKLLMKGLDKIMPNLDEAVVTHKLSLAELAEMASNANGKK